jgi:hypothetical protein
MNCSTCNNPLPTNGEMVTCSQCNRNYHYDDCSGLSANTWLAKSSAEKNKWRCKKCRTTIATRSKSEREEKSSPDIPSELKQGFAAIKESLEKMFTQHYNAMRDQLKQFENTIQENSKKMTELSEVFVGLKNDVLAIVEENKRIKESQMSLNAEIQDLRVQVQIMDQYSRNRNVEVHGIPTSKNENLDNLLQQLFKKVDLEMNKNDYIAHRMSPRRNGSQPIIIQFNNRNTRNQLMKKGKTAKLNFRDVQPDSPDSPIYLNENLNTYFKNLFFEVKQLNKQKGYAFIWFNNSKLFVKKSQGSKAVWIKSISDFEKLN